MGSLSAILLTIAWTAGADTVPAASGDVPAFQRVLIRADRVSGELRRALRSLPADDFETLIRRAAEARDPTTKPLLLSTKYRARLAGDDLVGTAVWSMRSAGAAPALLPLEPWTLALRRARWSENRPAAIADFDASAPTSRLALLLEATGDQTATLEWSARGIAEPGATRFDLRFPPCAVATFDLDLPADREPVVPKERGLLSGPAPAAEPGWNSWRLSMAGSDQLELAIIPRSEERSRRPIVLARLTSRQDLSLGQAACEFTFDVDVRRGGATALELQCDPDFRPTEMVARNLDHWTPSSREPRRWTLYFREPFAGGSIVIRGFVPLAVGHRWTSPHAELQGAISRGESLTIRAAAGLALDDWHAGSFRIVDSLVADRGQTLVLESELVGSARPSARISTPAATLRIHEQLIWRADQQPQRLAARLTLEPVNGALASASWRLPPEWDVEQVEGGSADDAVRWSIEPAAPPNPEKLLSVHASRPFAPGQQWQITVRLKNQSINPTNVSWPNMAPVGPADRTGTLTIKVPSGWHVTPSNPRDSNSEYQFALADVLTAGAHIERSAGGLSAIGNCDIELLPHAARVVHRITMQPRDRSIDAIWLWTSVPLAGKSAWRATSSGTTARVTEQGPIHPAQWTAWIGAPVLPAMASLACPLGNWQRVRLNAPVNDRVVLESQTEMPLHGDSTVGAVVPLFHIVAADSSEWYVRVDRKAAPEWDWSTSGGQSLWTRTDDLGRTSFRAGPHDYGVAIGRPPEADPKIDVCRVVVDARQAGRLVHKVTIGAWRGGRRMLRLDLPAGAYAVGATVAGRRIECAPRQNDGLVQLDLLMPATPHWQLELEYSIACGQPGIIGRLAASLPVLRIDAEPMQVAWILPSGCEPWPASKWVGQDLIGDESRGDAVSPGPSRLWTPVVGLIATTVLIANPHALLAISSMMAFISVVILLLLPAGLAFRMAVLVTLVGTLAWLWAPQPLARAAIPVVIAGGLLVVRPYGVAATAKLRGRRLSTLGSLTRLLMLGALGLVATSRAGAPDPVTVYYVLDGLNSERRPTVLAPPAFIDRLNEVAAARLTQKPVVCDARYEAQVNAGNTDVTATFQAYSLVEEPGEVRLLLSGVVLRSAAVDGRPALPRSAGQEVAVPVSGGGWHSIVLKFSAPVISGDGERLSFTVPEIAASHLSLKLPTGTTAARVAQWRGSQTTVSEHDGIRLEADLGRVNKIDIRWVSAARRDAKASRVQEAYLWDFRELSPRLRARLRYSIGDARTNLRIAVPRELAVISASARPTESTSTALTWLRDWHVDDDGGPSTVELRFSGPMAGDWLVECELVPKAASEPMLNLVYPSVLGITADTPYWAWQAGRRPLEVERVQGLSPIDASQFAQRAGPTGDLPPTQAYVRTRESDAVLQLRITKNRPIVNSRLTWTLGNGHAECEWTGTVRSATNRFALLEWHVPPEITIRQFTGDAVAAWRRVGPRLQVWFQRPVAESTLRWTGTMAWNPALQWELPDVRLVGVGGAHSIVLRAEPGRTIQPLTVQQLVEQGSDDFGGREWTYRAAGPTPRGVFSVLPAMGEAHVRLHTRIDRRGAQYIATTELEAVAQRGKIRSFNIVVQNAATAETKIQTDARVTERTATADRRAWTLDFPGTGVARTRATITSTGKPAEFGSWLIPTVTLDPPSTGVHIDTTIEIADDSLQVTEQEGLATEPLGARWRPKAAAWRMRVGAGERRPTADLVEVPFVEIATAQIMADRWVHQWVAKIGPGPATSLDFAWPERITLEAVALDDQSLAEPVQPSSNLSVPLPNRSTTRLLRIVWTTRKPNWPTRPPNPTVTVGGRSIPISNAVWTVALPAGYEITATQSNLTDAEIARLRLISAPRSGDPARSPARNAKRSYPFADSFSRRPSATWRIGDSPSLNLAWRDTRPGKAATAIRVAGSIVLLLLASRLFFRLGATNRKRAVLTAPA